MGNSILIVVAGSILLFAIANVKTYEKINKTTDNSINYYSDIQARNICNTTIEMLLSKIYSENPNFRTNGKVNQEMFGGEVSYTVEDVLVKGDSLIKITANGLFNGVKKQSIVFTGGLGGWVPPFVRGAWTANGNLNNTISDMFIDGRDHPITTRKLADSNNFIPGKGKYAVSTSVPFVNTQNAAIGGTGPNGVDYKMTYPENPAVIENYNWGGQFPKTPDEILGYPNGTLKSIAMSGVGGSQYVTNLKNIKWPLRGVTYFEPQSASAVEFVLSKPPTGQFHQGMLIVHRINNTSSLSGLKASSTTDPPFIGIVITDYSFHHHLNILGAIMQLSPNLETSKKCNGNKDHWVFYSSQAIINATELVAKVSGIRGNNNSLANGLNVLGGVGDRRYSVLNWYE